MSDGLAFVSQRKVLPLYFIVGGLVVAVGVLVFVFMGGHIPGQPAKVDVKIEAPKQ